MTRVMKRMISRREWLVPCLVVALALTLTPGVGAQDDREVQVNELTNGDQREPSVTSMAGGEFLVVWQGSFDGDGDTIEGRMLDSAGSPTGSQFQINTYTAGNQQDPVIVRTSDDAIVVAWDGVVPSPLFRRFSSTGVPQGDDVFVPNLGSTTEVQLAAGVDGSFLVVWDCFPDCMGGGDFDIFAQRYSSSGDALGDVMRVNADTADDQLRPRVDSLGANGFVVTWQTPPGSGPYDRQAFGRRLDSTGTPTGGDLSFGATLFDRAHDVTTNGLDEFIVVKQFDTNFSSAVEAGIVATRYDSFGSPIGQEMQFEANEALSLLPTSALLDAGGDLGIAFTTRVEAGPDENELNGGFVRFDSQGQVVEEYLQVNSYHPGNQYGGRLESIGDDFLIVWTSDGSLGTDDSSDSVQLRSSFSAIFGDDFESGSTALWHQTVGGL